MNASRYWRFGLARILVDPGPADADADAVRDRVDACPNLYSTGSGCPRVSREVNVQTRGRTQLLVKLSSSDPSRLCAHTEPISIFHLTPGRDQRVARGRTSDNGARGVFKAQITAGGHGSYYAVAKRHIEPSAGACEAAKSRPVRL